MLSVRALILLNFVAFSLVGVPVWWYFTSVERAELPAEGIHNFVDQWSAMLKDSNATQFVDLVVIHDDDSLQQHLSPLLETKTARGTGFLTLRYAVRQPHTDEINIFTAPSLEHKAINKALNKLDAGVTVNGRHRHTLYVASSKTLSSPLLHFGSQLAAWMLIPSGKVSDTRILGRLLQQVQIFWLRDIKPVVKASPSYNVAFSLIVAEPKEWPGVSWEISKALNRFIRPLLNQIQHAAQFSIESQILYFGSLGGEPKFDSGRQVHIVRSDALEQFRGANDWNLESFSTVLGVKTVPPPTIHFMTYIPPGKNYPLYLQDKRDNSRLSVGFSMPGWGAVAVLNKNASLLESHLLTQLDLEPTMQYFLGQLRHAFGMPSMNQEVNLGQYGTVSFSASKNGISEWERSALTRSYLQRMGSGAIEMLQSLLSMIEKLPQIKVDSLNRQKVEDSLQSLQTAFEDIMRRDLDSALNRVRISYELATDAFYSPDMVAQVYFPDDFKYAVYMPLFFPIALPLVMVLLKEVKRYLQKRRKATKIVRQNSALQSMLKRD